MVAHEILRFLKQEIEYRKDQVISGINAPSSELPAQYHYKIGFIHALTQVQDWVKEWEARKMSEDLE